MVRLIVRAVGIILLFALIAYQCEVIYSHKFGPEAFQNLVQWHGKFEFEEGRRMTATYVSGRPIGDAATPWGYSGAVPLEQLGIPKGVELEVTVAEVKTAFSDTTPVLIGAKDAERIYLSRTVEDCSRLARRATRDSTIFNNFINLALFVGLWGGTRRRSKDVT